MHEVRSQIDMCSSGNAEHQKASFTVVRPPEASQSPRSHVDFLSFCNTARHGGVLPGLHVDLHAGVQGRPTKVQGKHVLKACHHGPQIHLLLTGGCDLTRHL